MARVWCTIRRRKAAAESNATGVVGSGVVGGNAAVEAITAVSGAASIAERSKSNMESAIQLQSKSFGLCHFIIYEYKVYVSPHTWC